jgi:type I restriction enzyme M protein
MGRPTLTKVPTATNQGFKNIVVEDNTKADPHYVAYAATSMAQKMELMASGGTFKEISKTNFENLEIPLPPLDEQERIVAELEGYRKVIEGARQVLVSYKPTIRIDPKWPVRELGKIIAEKPKNGYSGKPVDYPTKVRVLSLSATTRGRLDLSQFKYLDEEIEQTSSARCRKGDILLQRGNTAELVGTAALFDADEQDYVYPDLMIRVRANESIVLSSYLLAALQSPDVRTFVKNNASGSAGSMPKINQSIVESIPVPVPPLNIQRQIVAELEAERKLVEANRELITRMEAKIKAKLGEVWGEESPEECIGKPNDRMVIPHI